MNTAGGPVDVNVYDVQMVFLLGVSDHGHILGDVRSPEFNPGGQAY